MKKFENDSTGVLSRFGRDKRQRIASHDAERVERRPRSQRDAADSEHPAGEERPQRRASYNPHFTRDNRPAFGQQRSFEGRDGSGESPRREWGAKPQHRFEKHGDGERRSYGNPHGKFGRDRRDDERFARRDEAPRNRFGEHDGERRFENDKPSGEHRFADRSSDRRFDRQHDGERKFSDRSGERRSYGDKPYGSRGKYGHDRDERRGDKPRYGESRFDKRGEGENRDSDRRFDKPRYGSDERRSYGDKPYGSRGKFDRDRRDDRRSDRPAYPRYNAETPLGAMRLNRFIAQSGICSRREADEFITAGLVSVNGVIVTELGTKVLPTDEVKFNDSRVQGEKKVYLVLNKPKGYVTSLEDPHADKTVMELVKGACEERIYPVGRLDKNSLGLLLFTNDGDMTKQLTHPSYRKKKIYQVALDKPLTRADMERIAEGITLEDGEIHADEISYVKENRQEVGIEIHSGRNRIVRRIFEFLGYTVTKLDRVYYAGLTKKNLKRGAWRFLTREEVERLKSGQYE